MIIYYYIFNKQIERRYLTSEEIDNIYSKIDDNYIKINIRANLTSVKICPDVITELTTKILLNFNSKNNDTVTLMSAIASPKEQLLLNSYHYKR
jgi:hypothetical protein